MQILHRFFAVWPLVACNLNPGGRYTHANFPDFACAWRLPGFNLHGLVAKRLIYLACVATSQMQNLHELAAIALQSRQFFAMTRGAQILKLKNPDKS